MAPKQKLSHKHVFIKLSGTQTPVSAALHDWDDDGIWIQDETLHKTLAGLAGLPAVPEFLKRNPMIFLPMHRVEWIMAAVDDLR